MGNNSSNNDNNATASQRQCSAGNQEMGRGWAHSFPRELARHHSQPPGHKVLPDPPNQCLRATNNGSIIHNGGTISGRRPSALTLPHDLNKGIYRSRSTSASNLGPRSRSTDQNQRACWQSSNNPRCRDISHEMSELKRFGSEPDLRYSPNSNSQYHNHHHHHHHQQQNSRYSDHQHQYYPERESRERESRYRGKKKYKAPPPPPSAMSNAAGNGGGAEGSSPDSYKWEENCCRDELSEAIQPPPRRSRLFKTRAESKKAQINWNNNSSAGNNNIQESESSLENERRWLAARQQQQQQKGKENRWREDGQDWSRSEDRGRWKKYEGKNTLQRSLSSPEFQAELMQVARKVRNKFSDNGSRIGPIGAATIISAESKLMDSRDRSKAFSSSDLFQNLSSRKNVRSRTEFTEENSRRTEKRKSSGLEESFEGAREASRSSGRFRDERRIMENHVKNDNRSRRNYEGSRSEMSQEPSRSKLERRSEERAPENSGHRRRIVEKTYLYEERITSKGPNEFISGRKSLNERLEILGNSLEERLASDGRRSFRESRDRHRINDKNRGSGKFPRKFQEMDDSPRTRSESPVQRNFRDRMDVRGQGSGRESTPEPPRGKKEKKIDHRKRRNETKVNEADDDDDEEEDDDERPRFVRSEKRRSESRMRMSEKAESKVLGEKRASGKMQQEINKESRAKNSNGLPPSGKTTPKTYYFTVDDGISREMRGNDDSQQLENVHTRLQSSTRHSNIVKSNKSQNRGDDIKNQNGMDDIALKLRPTLPKKQLEIPRFSPSAAWRLLSALETPGPTMSTASEEVPVMFEERIERLARPPPPMVDAGAAGAHRSSHDKSGDSGISGDAGGANDDSLDVSTTNRVKSPATRPAWTPQQDLGEESSSDAGVDSPPPMATSTSIKFPPRPHVFSLSLPRDDNNRLYPLEQKISKESASFNSLQKLKRSVSGAFGLGPADTISDARKRGEGLGENWLLSTSAPNSLQHNQTKNHDGENRSPSWDNKNYLPEENEADELDDILRFDEEKSDFPIIIMKPPSFSYLASGGHVMYLPESNDSEHTSQSMNYRKSAMGANANVYQKKNGEESEKKSKKIGSFGINGISINNPCKSREMGLLHRERSFIDLTEKPRKYENFFKSCDNISEMRQRSASPLSTGPENLQDPKNDPSTGVKTSGKAQKAKRFTFQSTVRQIERRRLAEKLSREAEAKERQRKSELEVMRKVEEEFQRKRAREKASIRQQLRLYSMDENSSLPPAWDSSHLSRADPDGAPSSSASSPTSAPPPGKMANRKSSSIGSDEYQHRKRVSESRAHQQAPQQHREYKDYRSKYYGPTTGDWSPEQSSSHNTDLKQTTVHPKVVYDIPKSSQVFLDANNIHTAKPANVVSTPRSDNYRKDFAHGAVAAKSSLASSDSELSQPNTRPHSRQNGNKTKLVRSRSASPVRSEGAGSATAESPVEMIKQERSPAPPPLPNGNFILNGVQPFVREKSYRPITFNPRPPPPPVPS